MVQSPFSLLSGSGTSNVAIIGAGPGGAAAAYYLSQQSPATCITVYESANYVGGRSTTVDVLGQQIELGASIFVDVNMNLVTASKLFNLTMVDPDEHLTPSQTGLAIWNGREFIYRDDGGWRFVNLAKLVWRYGLSPYRAQQHVAAVVNRFLGIYEKLPFAGLTETANEACLLQYTNVSTHAAYSQAGVSDAFINDIIHAATRVNYAQSTEKLHGLMGAVAFVTDSAMAIRGGNWLIFDEMIRYSRADLRLQTRVTSISQHDKEWRVCHLTDCEMYSHVVLAAPWQQANISIMAKEDIQILPVDYVELHVTLVATTARPSTKYFGAKTVPSSILTTTGDEEPEFLSFSVVGNADNVPIYKLFSHTALSDGDLRRLFDGLHQEDTIKRKTWLSYPKADVTAEFDEWEVAPNFWYLNGIERFISTMETATLAGRNVAGLISQRISP